MRGRLIEKTWASDPTLYAPPKYKKACRYRTFVPEPLSGMGLSIAGDIVGLLSEAERAIRALNELSYPALEPLARLLLRTESIASSRVEGMQIGVHELARAEAKVESGRSVSPTAREILSNIEAMVLAIDEASATQRFGIPQIQAIHERLMEHSHPRIAGAIRTRQNWIGGNDYNPCGADYVPPPPDTVMSLLEDLCEAINDEVHSPLVQAALVHAQFETIHPFDDGNGRTGRALIHVVLRRRNVAPRFVPPISVPVARSKDRYLGGLTSFRNDRVGDWIEYFAGAALRAARQASAYLQAADALKAEWRARVSALGSPRAGATVWEVLDALPAHPIVTVPVAAAATKRSKPSTYQAFELLVEAGVLIPLTQGARNQSWEARGVLPLIQSLEAGELGEEGPSAVT